jgi:hypothetical protein
MSPERPAAEYLSVVATGRAPRFALSDLQRRILALVGEGDWIATEDLMAGVGASREDVAAAVTELSEHGLMTGRVASLGSGWWNLTPSGRGLVRERAGSRLRLDEVEHFGHNVASAAVSGSEATTDEG